jgi:hypothetical protein
MERAKILGTASWLLACGAVSAGVRIETVSIEPGAPATGQRVQTVLVQDGKARAEVNRSGSLILKAGKIYVVDDKRQSYRELDKATMQGYAGQAQNALSQMQERMKSMPPEQRAQIEKMMGGMMGGASATSQDQFEAKDTGKSDTAEGRSCRVWNLLRNGQIYEEMCVVPFSSLPGKEDFETTFRQLGEAFEGVAAAVPNASKDSAVRLSVKGYPVRNRYFLNGQPTGRETRLKSWKEESIPAATFDIPAHYKKQENPMLPMPGG